MLRFTVKRLGVDLGLWSGHRLRRMVKGLGLGLRLCAALRFWVMVWA